MSPGSDLARVVRRLVDRARGTGAPCGSGRRATGCTPTRPGRSRGRRPCAACSLKCSTVSASPSASMPHMRGELGERPRLLQLAALEQLLREVPGVRAHVGVPLAVAVVEDQPARHGPARLVALVHGLADLHVRVRLVHEPPAGGVDVDRARPLAGLVERRLAEPAGARRRQPPRLVHQVGLRAEPHRGRDRLAGVAGVGHRPLALVGLVAAVLARASRGCGRSRRRRCSTPWRARTEHRRAVAHRAHADDPAVLDDQVLERRLGPDRDALRRGRSSSSWPMSDAPFVSSAWPAGLGGDGADARPGPRWRSARTLRL